MYTIPIDHVEVVLAQPEYMHRPLQIADPDEHLGSIPDPQPHAVDVQPACKRGKDTFQTVSQKAQEKRRKPLLKGAAHRSERRKLRAVVTVGLQSHRARVGSRMIGDPAGADPLTDFVSTQLWSALVVGAQHSGSVSGYLAGRNGQESRCLFSSPSRGAGTTAWQGPLAPLMHHPDRN